jgi:hypothetical protein
MLYSSIYKGGCTIVILNKIQFVTFRFWLENIYIL